MGVKRWRLVVWAVCIVQVFGTGACDSCIIVKLITILSNGIIEDY